jgi:hypothetical protein
MSDDFVSNFPSIASGCVPILRKIGAFRGVHPMPQSGQDVPDDFDARLAQSIPRFCRSV